MAFENKRWFDQVRKELVVKVNKDLYPNVSDFAHAQPFAKGSDVGWLQQMEATCYVFYWEPEGAKSWSGYLN
ncbi:hypothetical protein [Spirosoma telluris]|uniref:hypothetical protein n=1 Tax=Spirosoma telluris TaxID=2183553 RepID=UPI0012FA8FE6